MSKINQKMKTLINQVNSDPTLKQKFINDWGRTIEDYFDEYAYIRDIAQRLEQDLINGGYIKTQKTKTIP